MNNAVHNFGYSFEGIVGHIFPDQHPGTIPLYRMYSPGAADHFYTTNTAERDNAINNLGYNNEGITGFVFPNGRCGGQPLYRLFSGRGADHLYTMDNPVAHDGYDYEEIAAFIYTP